MVHILVAKAFIPNNNSVKIEVNHKNSIPFDNNYTNLEWVTEQENVNHAILNSYSKNNGKHWKSKISNEDASFIRNNFKSKYTALELSKMFNIDLSSIYRILRNEYWKLTNDKGTIFKRGQQLL